MGLRRISCLLSSSVKRLFAVAGEDVATDAWETINPVVTGGSSFVFWETNAPQGGFPNWEVWG